MARRKEREEKWEEVKGGARNKGKRSIHEMEKDGEGEAGVARDGREKKQEGRGEAVEEKEGRDGGVEVGRRM